MSARGFLADGSEVTFGPPTTKAVKVPLGVTSQYAGQNDTGMSMTGPSLSGGNSFSREATCSSATSSGAAASSTAPAKTTK